MKPLYLLVMLAILPSLALAQTTNTSTDIPPPQGQGPHHGLDPAKELEHLTTALDLSTTQQTEILPLLQKLADTLKTIHENTSLTEQEKQDHSKTAFQDTNEEIEAVLTSDQVAKFKDMHKHHGPPPQ